MPVGSELGTTNSMIGRCRGGKADRHTKHRRIAQALFGGAFTAT
jgi:hypothetical protein